MVVLSVHGVMAHPDSTRWWIAPSVLASVAPSGDPLFQSNLSAAFEVEGMYLWPLTSSLTLVSGVGAQWMPASFTYDESVVLSINDDPIPATIEHLRAVPLLRPYATTGVRFPAGTYDVSVGLRVGYNLTSSFTDRQQFVDLPGVEFDDDDVAEISRPLPDFQPLYLATVVGLGLPSFHVGSFALQPAINGQVVITTPSTAVMQQQFSIGLQLRVGSAHKPVQVPAPIPVVTVPEPIPEPIPEPNIVEPTIVESPSDLMFASLGTTVVIGDRATPSRTITFQRIEHKASISSANLCPNVLVDSTIVFQRPATRSDVLDTLAQILDESCNGADASTISVVWVEEVWPPCSLQFDPSVYSEEPVDRWTIMIRGHDGELLDSIAGDLTPPARIAYLIPQNVLRYLVEHGSLTCEFHVWDVSGAFAAPVRSAVQIETPRQQDDLQRWVIQRTGPTTFVFRPD